jgi:hypothetical protein
MALSIFEDKLKEPVDNDLKKALGDTYEFWNIIKNFLIRHYPSAEEEWKFAGQNYGWGFRLKDKKRVIIYMTPADKFFRFSLVLGEKATQEAMNSKISQATKLAIKAAPVYAEGRGFRSEIKDSKFIEDIKALILIKLKN